MMNASGGVEEVGGSLALRELILETTRDVVYALRMLKRARWFAAVAISTLALGIGASTALFTIVDSVLLRPLRFTESDRLAVIRPTSGSRVSAGYLYEWRLQNRSMADIAGWRDHRANLTGREGPIEVLVDQTTANYFSVLGTPPSIGRTFSTPSDLSHVAPEIVLSHGFWQRRYGRADDVLGAAMVLDGATYTIVGVMPDGFTIRTTELAESRAELWTAFPLIPEDRTGMGGALNVVGRLRPGATMDEAQADLTVIARAIEQQNPSYSREWGVEVVPLLDATVSGVRPVFLVLFGAVGILLLLACANVANLTLGRASTRQVELAIRLSLGATVGRLVRQLLTESLLLGLAGGTLGASAATWGTTLLVSALPAGIDLPRTHEIHVDLRILLFSVAVTVLTVIVFGVIPALSSARSASRSTVRMATHVLSSNRLQAAIVISEIALAMVLLSGAGLLTRSFWQLVRVDPGFQPARVLTMRTTLHPSRYGTDDRVRAFGSALLDRVQHLPGVLTAGSVNYLPMSRFGVADRFEIEGRPETRLEDQKFSWVSVAGGRYFEAMGIPLLRGRLPDESDATRTRPVFLIDEELARRYWPDEDAVGAHIVWRRGERAMLSGEIIGIVGSVRWQTMAADPDATAYWWFSNAPSRELTIVARTAGPPSALVRLMAAQVGEIDPDQPVADIRPMEDLVSADLARPRFTMVLLGGFAAVALLMAGIGLHGVVALSVAQRTREIGVRIALGAEPPEVFRLVMRRGIALVGAGLAIGVASALAFGRFVTALLYGIRPTDPTTLAAVSLFLSAVVLLASFVPARRATRIDPAAALRGD